MIAPYQGSGIKGSTAKLGGFPLRVSLMATRTSAASVIVDPVGGDRRFHRSHGMLGSSRYIERAKLARSRASIRVPRQGASWSLEALAPEIPVPHSIGLNLQNQCPKRDMDFPAREHFRSDGGFCRVRALAKVLAEKGGQRLKLCN